MSLASAGLFLVSWFWFGFVPFVTDPAQNTYCLLCLPRTPGSFAELFKAGSDTALFAPNCGSSSGVEETWVSTISTEIDPHFPKMLQRRTEITQKAAEAIVTRKLNRCSQQVYIAVQKQSPYFGEVFLLSNMKRTTDRPQRNYSYFGGRSAKRKIDSILPPQSVHYFFCFSSLSLS